MRPTLTIIRLMPRLMLVASLVTSTAIAGSTNVHETQPSSSIRILSWSDLAQESAKTKPSSKNDDYPSLPDLGHFAHNQPSDWPMSDATKPSAQTNNMADNNKLFNNEVIKIAGFIVPLSDNENRNSNSDFFLVPNFGAILFEPPPARDQIILVKIDDPLALSSLSKPVWITGTLSSQTVTRLGTTASYVMDARTIEPYVAMPNKKPYRAFD